VLHEEEGRSKLRASGSIDASDVKEFAANMQGSPRLHENPDQVRMIRRTRTARPGQTRRNQATHSKPSYFPFCSDILAHEA
jgi:hypothetical protein